VTADSGIFKVIDITGARDAAFIRERIFADVRVQYSRCRDLLGTNAWLHRKMQISDENQTHFSIYRTEVGSYAIGDALADEHLYELCRDHGDAYASLKFMVSHTSAAVHESPHDSSYSQKFYTIPPPVVVPRSNDVYSPVRSQHRCGSPPRSLSSASERLPQESGGGYDASVSDDNADAPERDPNRTTIKPGSFKTAQRIAPPSAQSPSPSTIVERGRTEIAPLRIEKHHLSSHPPQTLSPGSSRFPFMEDSYTLPTRRTPHTASSDAALERERALEDSEVKLELAGQQWKAPQQETEEKEKQRTRERDRERETQRRQQPKSRGTGSEHWTVVPSDIPIAITRRSVLPGTIALARPRLGAAKATMSTRHGTRQAKAEIPGEQLAHLYRPTGRCLGLLPVERQSQGYHLRHHLLLIAVTGAWETCAVPRQNTQPRYNPVSADLPHLCPWRDQQHPAPLKSFLSLTVCSPFHDHLTLVTTSFHLSPRPRDLYLWLETRRLHLG
jgi:hypothetical protein